MRSGQERIKPMVYQTDSDRLVIEVGSDTMDVNARVAEGEERERLWSRQKEIMPAFADYEQRTDRQIPVVILERV